jgi:hypothetical protein
MRSYAVVAARRFSLVVLVATTALLAGAATASAGVSISVSPAVPSSVTVGGNPATSLSLTNGSFNGPGETNFDTDSFQVNDLTLVPSCGSQAFSADCQAGSFDPGALVPGATGLGQAGTACAGRTFTISLIDAAQGKYRLTPDASIILGPPGGPSSQARCVIDFTASVNRVPAIDSSPNPGLQTDQKAFAQVESITVGSPNFGLTGGGIGTARTTVNRVTPSLSTTATPPPTPGSGGSVSDVAHLSGATSPTGTITFNLYGPGDAPCAGAAVFTVTKPVSGNGSYISAGFTPTQFGTYRWIAVYSGDANNQPVSGACNDPAESVLVSPPARALALSTTGAGSGFVDSSPTGIDCGRNSAAHADCAESYADGTSVTLTAHPLTNTEFTGFTGDCVNAGLTCTTTMNQARSVTATFTLMRTLSVDAPHGTGVGYIDSSPAGIDCGNVAGHGDCTETVPDGTQITLTAHPNANSGFGGFTGGGCSTSPCTVTVDANKVVYPAMFLKPLPLDLTTAGSGSGYIDSSPAGIDCGRNIDGHTDCAESYDPYVAVTLTAHPASDSAFAGFTGACADSGPTCTITTDAAKSVTATFELEPGPGPPDTTTPATEITRMPSNPRPKRSHFNFVSSEPDSTFTCQIDELAPEPCTAPHASRGLKRGRHTFSVFATDPAGNADPTPATASFRVRRARNH